eukprot:CAMPEP_0170551336 /NCGR_PEP_ID=MMETSP0211-20121228/9350_1 /TAXON_ID=311385 /ORGANISM="Pseudokeronopsis sp., Strain OXSARD2" /LENGTH=228 /DNA_ID=CAMNT_0010858439 /DNA_START=62 /DNA_END=748 /DNA_ORIENTATION=-
MLLTDLYICATQYTDYLGLVMGIFVLLCLGFKISGAHYNPSVTLAFMLRKNPGGQVHQQSPRNRLHDIQVGGGVIGGLVALMLLQEGGEVVLISTDYMFSGILSETLGSFLLIFLYLSQTEEETKLSKDPTLTILMIAGAYLSFLMMVSPPDKMLACLNPCVALGSDFAMYFSGQYNGVQGFEQLWLFGLCPFGGSLLAVFFHEVIYKRLVQNVVEKEEREEKQPEKR